MREAIESFDYLEHGYEVDGETGEILSGPDFTMDNLPIIGRQLSGIERRKAMIEDFKKAEIQRIREVCDNKILRLDNQVRFFLSKAESVIGPTGEDRVEYPGIGVFRFSKKRESVDDSEYLSFEKDKQVDIQKQAPDMFREKTTYSPDKKAILEAIKDGKTLVGFSLSGGGKEFVFKPE